ncbi:MAG: pseudouridine synthase [Actinomycetota bacterium]|jgi:23S rRNA pseudouridine2605 synthase|nr:pseudouridine synthase [Actinomycetota bacterium]
MVDSHEQQGTGERVVPMRLQKFLARAGAASRRGSEDLMTAGRVAVNGETVSQLGSKVDPRVDVVTVDGKLVELHDGPTYLVLNKPAGYLTTMDDPQGRPTVADIMPREPAGLFPVGRLDMDTTGVLLFMTDGDLAFRVLHPKFHVEKRYVATVKGSPSTGDLESLANGIELEDGPTKPAEVRRVSSKQNSTVVEIVLSEGRKRQVKRMFLAIGHPVVTLHRASFGPVVLGDLPEGSTRPLTVQEIAAIRAQAGVGV